MDIREFSIPLNVKTKKYNRIVVITVAALGILVAAFTSFVWYAISGFGCALLCHVLGHYQDDYRQPSKVTVGDNGILLQYRRKRPKFIAWHQVQSLFISKRPGKTVADAALKPVRGGMMGLSLEAGLYIAEGYRSIYGRPIPDWNAR
jgi:hypothetical protein